MRRRRTETTLFDADPTTPGRQFVEIEVHKNSICLMPSGYGDCGSADGYGVLALMERWRGRLRLVVWTDIGKEEPLVIDLEGAREDRRTVEAPTE